MKYDIEWAKTYLRERGYGFDITDKWGLTIEVAPDRKPTAREKIAISKLNQ